MEDNKKPTKDEQGRIDVCENVVNWTCEDREHRGCIVLATDEESSTCAVVGHSRNLITAFVSAIRSTPKLRDILTAAMMLDMVTDGSESDTDKD